MSVLKVKDNGEWKDIPSIKGEQGDAAGFGVATASVDTGTGTPSCVVTLSGDDTAKNFDFAFHNLMYDDSDLQSDFADLESDFNTLQGQFDTAVAALTVDSEVADIRVGDDGVTYASAGAAVRGQFHDVKSDLNSLGNPICPLTFELGKAAAGATNAKRALSNAVLSSGGYVYMNIKTLPSNIKVELEYYNGAAASSYANSSGSWITQTGLQILQKNYPYVRVLLGSVDDSAITEAMISTLDIELSIDATPSAYDKVARDAALASSNLLTDHNGQFTFTNHKINDSTGALQPVLVRAASYPIAVEKNTIIGLKDYTTYKFIPYFYNLETGAYIGYGSATWLTTDYVVPDEKDHTCVRVLICKVTNPDYSKVSPTEAQYQLKIQKAYATEDAEKDIDALQRAEHKDVLVMMTHNVGLFNDGGGTRCPDADVNSRKAMFAELFAKYRPDFIFTQESPLYMNVSNTVLGSSVYLPYFANYEGSTEDFAPGYAGYMGRHIATSYPLIDTTMVSHGGGTRTYIKSYTYINNVKVALYDIHLGLTAEARATEITNLLADMATEEFFICGGDTNAEYEELAPFVTAGYKVVNQNDFVTDSGGGHIDNFITSANIKLIHTRMDSTIFASMHDHNPLIAYFVIDNTANVPTIPKDNGTYTLKANVSDGAVTYQWVSD